MKFREIENYNIRSFDGIWKGIKKGYTTRINQNSVSENGMYWFFIEKEKEDYVYNSLWDQIEFNTFEECCKQAESHIDNIK